MKKEGLVLAVLYCSIFLMSTVEANKIIEDNLIRIERLEQTNPSCLRIFANDTGIENVIPSIKIDWGSICFELVDRLIDVHVIQSIGGLNFLTINGTQFISIGQYYTGNTFYNGGNIEAIKRESVTSFNIVAERWDDSNAVFVGIIDIFLKNRTGFIGDMQIKGIIIEDNEKRISRLESWKQTIDDLLETLQDTITDILTTLTSLVTKTNDHEDRILNLEGKNETSINQTFPDYLKYLDKSTRKDIVCGYAQDNRLTHIEDLGWSCDLTYRETRRGERVTCRCKQL